MQRFHQRLIRNAEKQTQRENRTQRYPPKPRKGDKRRENAACFELPTPE